MLSAFQCRRCTFDNLSVEIHPTPKGLGQSAARSAANYINNILSKQGEARVIFACAPSQNEFLATLVDPSLAGTTIDWSRVTAFHMDDYVGLTDSHPQSFRFYLNEHLLRHVPVGRFHPLQAEDPDTRGVCEYYTHILTQKPIDLICMGIGENGHIAFNDPPVVDFNDPATVKVVELDRTCRQQQVNDGCFDSFEQVPTLALTLTVPVFRQAKRLSIHVPGHRKAKAVKATLVDPISTSCPASILRTHSDATLFLDSGSAYMIDP